MDFAQTDALATAQAEALLLRVDFARAHAAHNALLDEAWTRFREHDNESAGKSIRWMGSVVSAVRSAHTAATRANPLSSAAVSSPMGAFYPGPVPPVGRGVSSDVVRTSAA